jgi:uncharacterized membrane protein HdeD (DUF308 family)
MPLVLIDSWWTLAIRGVLAVLFGLAALLLPGITLVALVLLFGAYALADGIIALIAGARGLRRHERSWPLLLEGVLGIAAGVLTVVWPGITALVLVYLIAAWALLTGALEIATAIRLRKIITGEWLLVLSGVVSILLGVILVVAPGAGALGLVLWIGAYALVFGVLLLILAFRLRSWARAHPESGAVGVAG